MSATPALDRFTKPQPARKGIALFNLTRMPVFIAVQALAALSLDGWLSVALWINATYNAVLFLITVAGLAFVAVEVSNKERAA